MSWFNDNKKNVKKTKKDIKDLEDKNLSNGEFDEDELLEKIDTLTKRIETIENTEMKLLRDELIDLKKEERRRTRFLEEMLFKVIEQAKPLVKPTSALDAYLAKKDGQASSTQSVKEAQKSKLPG